MFYYQQVRVVFFGVLVLGGGVLTLLFRRDLSAWQFRLFFADRGRDQDMRILDGMNLAVSLALLGFGLLMASAGIVSGNWY